MIDHLLFSMHNHVNALKSDKVETHLVSKKYFFLSAVIAWTGHLRSPGGALS